MSLANVKTLQELLSFLNNFDGDFQEAGIDTTSLPTFGGDEPESTLGIFSWDEKYLLVPASGNGFKLVAREIEEE
ncbi:hypothetical protein VN23_09040 [Janthinobacterium sp. B9-8]|nr:hypothetical protein VN23_09040 [Janthinobacterium sp. B9-8]